MTPRVARPPNRKTRNRAAILDVARALFTRRGFHGVGLNEVARDAGLTRRTVYSHFASKADLLLTLVERVHETELRAELASGVAGAPSALAAIAAAIAANAAYLRRIEDFARVMRSARLTDAAVEAAYQKRMRRRHRLSRDLAQRFQREGVLAKGLTIDDADDLLWALLSFDVYELLALEARWSLTRYQRHLTRVTALALLTPSTVNSAAESV